MTAINHEYYVSLEVAKLLKVAGFDWECNKAYHDRIYNIRFYNDEQIDDVFAIPTLNVAQRWLREVKGFFVCAVPEIKDYHATWIFYICNEHGLFYEYEDCFLTHEEAQEAGIKKTLEIILEKGE